MVILLRIDHENHKNIIEYSFTSKVMKEGWQSACLACTRPWVPPPAGKATKKAIKE
jgi:hypothetical protein